MTSLISAAEELPDIAQLKQFQVRFPGSSQTLSEINRRYGQDHGHEQSDHSGRHTSPHRVGRAFERNIGVFALPVDQEHHHRVYALHCLLIFGHVRHSLSIDFLDYVARLQSSLFSDAARLNIRYDDALCAGR